MLVLQRVLSWAPAVDGSPDAPLTRQLSCRRGGHPAGQIGVPWRGQESKGRGVLRHGRRARRAEGLALRHRPVRVPAQVWAGLCSGAPACLHLRGSVWQAALCDAWGCTRRKSKLMKAGQKGQRLGSRTALHAWQGRPGGGRAGSCGRGGDARHHAAAGRARRDGHHRGRPPALLPCAGVTCSTPAPPEPPVICPL